MANLQLPLNQDHEVVLGSEYCSGYKDPISNEWHTGFYCPASDESEDVFCCGTSFRKYCCTKKDKVLQSEIQDLTILIGIIVGASAAIMIITLVSCFCCSCCILYKKRNSPTNGPMYRFHNASEHSGVTNMYSLSGGASRTGTPQINSGHYHRMIGEEGPPSSSQFRNPHRNGGMSHSHTLPHSLSHHSKSRQSEMNAISMEHGRAYGTLGRLPRERPPPYHDLPASAYLPPPQNIRTNSVVEEMRQLKQMEPPKEISLSDENAIKAIETEDGDSPLPPPPCSNNEPHAILFSNAVAEASGDDAEQLFHSTKF